MSLSGRCFPLAGEQTELCARRGPEGAGLGLLRAAGVPAEGRGRLADVQLDRHGAAAGLRGGRAAEPAVCV